MAVRTSIVDGVALIAPDATVSSNDAIELITSFFAEMPSRHVVWDFRGASLSAFTASGFREVSAAAGKFDLVRGPAAKTAYVVSDEFERMLMEAYCDSSRNIRQVELGVFMDMDTAFAWIAE